MKNPLLAIIALVALAGILLAQAPPSTPESAPTSPEDAKRAAVPLRNHLSIPWTASNGSPFTWVCPAGMHARVTLAETWGCGTTLTYLTLASGEQAQFGSQSHGQNAVIHPGDTLTVEPGCGGNPSTGILQLAVEYD